MKLVDDFATVSIDDQAELFYSSHVQIMSHGGQFGNSIFTTKNTVIIEVTCGYYSHMATGGEYTAGLEFFHIVYKPCSCPKSSKDSANYKLPTEEFFGILQATSTKLTYGTIRLNCVSYNM